MGGAPERLLEDARPHRPRRLARRELRVEAISAGALIAVAGAMAALIPSSRALSPDTLALYAALYVAASRVRLYVGAGSALPTQLIFVPMLFALPPGAVPLVVAGGLAASAVIDVVFGRAHPERIVTAAGDGWYAVAPAAVFALAGAPPPELGHWPVFLTAFAAQSALDALASTAREWAGRAIRPGLQLRVMASVYAVDALLAPVGLLVAVTAERHDLAALLAAPLLILLAIFAGDRRMRIEQAIGRLEELERERARLQGTIRRVGEAFASNLDRHTLLALVIDTALDALEAPRGRASAGGEVVSRDSQADDDDELTRALDAAEQAALADGPLEPVARGTAWAIARPLRALGTISLARRDRPFSREEQELIGYLASQGAVSLENARLHEELYRQATVDELTGLSNHRRLQQALDEELARSRRFPAPLSLVILDIDDFKAVNDTHGHLQGDLVLREVARAVREHCREIDEAARYGGEELAVMLRGTSIEGAYRAAETIRKAIEALRVPVAGGGDLRVTASFGIAELHRGEANKNQLIAAADTALYEAKRRGKNRTVKARLVRSAPAGPA
jgi:diguanylate cyclase (GGDEF)-like protein